MKLLLVAFILVFAGCAIPVPSNEARFGDMSFKFPKDVEITGLSVTKTGARSFTLRADSWKSKNNPDVIMQSADGQAKIIEATGNVAAKVGAAVVEGAVKGAAK